MAWDFAARRSQQDRPASMRPIDWRAQQMGRWVEQQRQRLIDLYRDAASTAMMEEIIGEIQQQLPAGISPTELRRFLQQHQQQLRKVLAQALPVEIAQQALR